VRTAIEMLESATRIDARFAEAWARLAEAYVMMGSVLDPNMRWLQKAERAIEKALRLDRDNAEAHCSHGRVLWTAAKGYQNRPALAALARYLELDPGYHPARLWLCLIFVHVGLLEEAKRGLVEVLATNLDDAFSLVFMGQTLFYLRDFDGASEYYARALQMDQANIWANLFLPTVPLYAGQLDRAEQQIRSALQMAPGEPTVVAAEGLLWALRGEKRRAEQTLARALRGADRPVLHTHHMLHNAAAAYAFLGRASRAVALLDKAARIGLPNYPVFRDDPHFASLADDAGYRRLMRRLSSEWERYRLDFGGLRR